MLFSSGVFLFLFLPLVLAGYLALPSVAPRNMFLLAASAIFYCWGEPRYGWLIILLIAIVHNLAQVVERQKNPAAKKAYLALALICCIGSLAWFKYGNFLLSNINELRILTLHRACQFPTIALPLGISFIAFHLMSYLIDVYRGVARAQKQFSKTALYISLFPQLIAGPIVRYHEIADQLSTRVVTSQLFAGGIQRFIFGLSKKVLIADTIGRCVDRIYEIPAAGLTPELAWLGAVGFVLQIYFDFSGYSDMAIGLAALFGFRFPENFNYPYIAQSMTDLWRRWHMSLTRWFREYLYIPLGGNRCGRVRTAVNLFTVFFLCGLWHGANWTFIVWGLYQGLFLFVERTQAGNLLSRLWRPCRHLYVLLVWLVGLVVFRSTDLAQSANFLLSMSGVHRGDHSVYPLQSYITSEVIVVLLIGAIASIPLNAIWKAVSGLTVPESPQGYTLKTGFVAAARLACIAGLFFFCMCEVAYGTYNAFIYFRF